MIRRTKFTRCCIGVLRSGSTPTIPPKAGDPVQQRPPFAAAATSRTTVGLVREVAGLVLAVAGAACSQDGNTSAASSHKTGVVLTAPELTELGYPLDLVVETVSSPDEAPADSSPEDSPISNLREYIAQAITQAEEDTSAEGNSQWSADDGLDVHPSTTDEPLDLLVRRVPSKAALDAICREYRWHTLPWWRDLIPSPPPSETSEKTTDADRARQLGSEVWQIGQLTDLSACKFELSSESRSRGLGKVVLRLRFLPSLRGADPHASWPEKLDEETQDSSQAIAEDIVGIFAKIGRLQEAKNSDERAIIERSFTERLSVHRGGFSASAASIRVPSTDGQPGRRNGFVTVSASDNKSQSLLFESTVDLAEATLAARRAYYWLEGRFLLGSDADGDLALLANYMDADRLAWLREQQPEDGARMRCVLSRYAYWYVDWSQSSRQHPVRIFVPRMYPVCTPVAERCVPGFPS